MKGFLFFLVNQDSRLCFPLNVTPIICLFLNSKIILYWKFSYSWVKKCLKMLTTYILRAFLISTLTLHKAVTNENYLSCKEILFTHDLFRKIWLFVKSASEMSQSVGTTWIGKKRNKRLETNSWPKRLLLGKPVAMVSKGFRKHCWLVLSLADCHLACATVS